MGRGAIKACWWVMYGTGDVLGAGIFGLIAITPAMAAHAQLALAVAAGWALLTFRTCAALGRRYPSTVKGGFIAKRAFPNAMPLWYVMALLAPVLGLLAVATGARVFAAYALVLRPATPPWLIICLLFAALSLMTLAGVRLGARANSLAALAKGAALVFIILIAAPPPPAAPAAPATTQPEPESVEFDPTLLPPPPATRPAGPPAFALSAVLLALFAFRGVVEMFSAPEENEHSSRVGFGALAVGLVVVSILYVLTAHAAATTLGRAHISAAPLADVVTRARPGLLRPFAIVALLAIGHTLLDAFALTARQIARLAHERAGLLPTVFSAAVGPREAPAAGILLAIAIALPLSLAASTATLAIATACVMLLSAGALHACLVALRFNHFEGSYKTDPPLAVPIAGSLASVLLLATSFANPPAAALALGAVVLAVVLYFILRPGTLRNEMLLADL